MKKKLLIVAIVAVMVLTMACCFVACNKAETVVNATYLEKGFYSIKEYYAKDEALDLNGATIKYYTDVRDSSTAQEIAVTADMISGFSTATVGENKTCTLTYKDKTLTYTYSVYEPQAVDTAITSGAKYILTSISSAKANSFVFDTTNKQVTKKEYDNYPAWQSDTAATTENATYKYEILAGGVTVLSAKLGNVEYRFANITSTTVEVTTYGSGTAITGPANKYDASAFVNPPIGAYISQIVDETTHKYKAIKISEKNEDYSDRPQQYLIAVIDSDYNLKIYLSDTFVDEADTASLANPTFVIEATNTTFSATTLSWRKNFDGRSVTAQGRKEGDHFYLYVNRQANSTAEPPIIGYIINAYTYDTIDQSVPA